MRCCRAIILQAISALAFLSGFAASAAASDTTTAPFAKLKALLPPSEDATLCLGRRYGQEHLNEHPKQNVTELLLSIRYRPLSEEDAVLEATDDGGIDKRRFIYDFTLAAKVRDQKDTLYASGDCSSAEGIGCGVDCDGGGLALAPTGGDGTVMMHLERIRMTLGCLEGPHQVDLQGGEDDKTFRLEPTPVAACKEMQADAAKEAE